MAKWKEKDHFQDFLEEVDEEEYFVKKEKCPIDDMQLLRLSQCAIPTRMNLVDRGNPDAYARLAMLKLTEKVGDGYRVTADGFAFLSRWHEHRKKVGAA